MAEARPPSPCLDVCKYRLRGHCIACGMTQMQKRMAERPQSYAARKDFLRQLLEQQARLGARFLGFPSAYRAKCARYGAPCPLDELEAERTAPTES